MTRITRISLTTLLLVLLGASLARARNDEAHPCHSDRFFLHIPLGAAVPFEARAPGIEARLQGELDRLLGVGASRLTAVLPRRDAPMERRDGHLRFWSIRVPGATLAEVPRLLGNIRAAGERAFPRTPLYVGRECRAVGLGSPRGPDWHLDLMGATAVDGSGAATIVLIDSGFRTGRSGLPAPDWSADGLPKAMHPHGASMRGAIEQLATDATVLDYRVLGPGGTGSLTDVARAIDHAVFEVGGPAVINLSLGYPPELERERVVRALDGSTLDESPVGEAIRHGLMMARLRDDGGFTGAAPGGPMAVVMASGNRARLHGLEDNLIYERLFQTRRTPPELPPFDCSAPSDRDLFYPAQFARRGSCLRVGGVGLVRKDAADSNLVAVGATDFDDRLSALSPRIMAPTLVAPGVHVEVDGRTITGSSVAAAFTSTAVALRLRPRRTGRGVVGQIVADAAPLDGGRARLDFGGEPGVVTLPDAPEVEIDLEVSPTALDRAGCLRDFDGEWSALSSSCPDFMTLFDQHSAALAGPLPNDTGCAECGGRVSRQFMMARRAAPSAAGACGALAGGEVNPATIEIHGRLAALEATLSDPHLVVDWSDGTEQWLALPIDDARMLDLQRPFRLTVPLDPPVDGAEMRQVLLVLTATDERGKSSANVSIIALVE